jgi:hypothetical protein
MATKIRPIVFKIDEPEGFVMNASNLAGQGLISGQYFLCWKGPEWPAGCNLNGQTARITISSDISTSSYISLMYAQDLPGGSGQPGGPTVLSLPITAGTYDITCGNNMAGSTFGVYLNLGCPSEEVANQVLAKCTITILDP